MKRNSNGLRRFRQRFKTDWPIWRGCSRVVRHRCNVKYYKLSILSVCFLTLVGCSSIQPQPTSTAPSDLMSACPAIPPQPQSRPGQTNMGDLLTHDENLMNEYG